jgi:hypothetical protein
MVIEAVFGGCGEHAGRTRGRSFSVSSVPQFAADHNRQCRDRPMPICLTRMWARGGAM